MRALLFVLMATAVVPTAWASECFSIQDADARNACLSSAKGDRSYCFKIQNVDQRNACLGTVKTDRSYCFKIQNKDPRNDCLANTPR